tara:strand:- start:192 stop:389 length:198 start_codon:yes stop_codon:yes gene_type:complete
MILTRVNIHVSDHVQDDDTIDALLEALSEMLDSGEITASLAEGLRKRGLDPTALCAKASDFGLPF